MIAALVFLAAGAVSGGETTVGNWQIRCENDGDSTDGKFDRCRINSKQDGVEVAIVRDANGAQFTVRYKVCKPKNPVASSIRTADELTGENADKLMIGGVIEQLIMNCRESKHGRGALVIPMSETDAHQILQVTGNLRPKVTNAQTH